MERHATRRRQRRISRQYWFLLGIILLAFVLRAYHLGRDELWFDEALSAVIAGKGLTGIVTYTQSTPFEHPPLYYLSLHTWMQAAGSSEFALRFFSLFWGVLLIPLLYRFMAPWGGRSLALLVALVAALSVTYIGHSQSARMYSVMPVLAVLLLLCFFRALATQRWWWWVGFVLAGALGVATHYYFALMLLVPMVFLFLSGPRYRRLLVLLVVIAFGCVLLVAGWFWLSPGFRQAIQQVIAGEGGGVSSLSLRILHTAGGLFLEQPVVGHLAMGGLALLGVILWPLASPPRDHPVSLVGSRGFLLVWLFVPWLAALAIPYWLQDRHLAYLWPALYGLIACGLLALRARSKVLFVAGLLLIAVTSGYGLYLKDTETEFQFGQIMAYIEDRALPDDLVIMNQPSLWPFAGYYPRRNLTMAYVPANGGPPSEEAVDQQMRALVGQRSRVWAGPSGAWTADPELLVERWLATYAFQAHKEWFPGSGSAALYFTTNLLDPLPVDQGLDWEGRIRLLTAQSSPRVLAPGDALRLSFDWEASQPMDSPYSVSLYLADDATSSSPDGAGSSVAQVWAERQSEPCSGWCPTDTWEPGTIIQDRHALQIPPGTPPGTYSLQVAWYAPGEGRELSTSGGIQRVDLGQVRVVRPEERGGDAPPRPPIQYPLQVAFGEQIVLQGFDLDQSEIPAGGTLALDLHWLAQSRPLADYSLQLDLVGPDRQAVASWERSPAMDALPTSKWLAGDYLRGQQRLALPRQIAPGRYQLQLRLLDAGGRALSLSGSRPRQVLGSLIRWQATLDGDGLELATLRVSESPDRAHNFDLPAIAYPLSLRFGQQVELLGYDLETKSAMPGGQVELTLYWRGRGATDRPYKVFTHLSDEQPLLRAQDDSHPGKGCCPTDTWLEGEVVVDRHIIPLAADLPSGTYHLTAGMYDEPTGLRLPVLDAQGHQLDQDHVSISEVVVRPGITSVPTPVRPTMAHRVYLPLVRQRTPHAVGSAP